MLLLCELVASAQIQHGKNKPEAKIEQGMKPKTEQVANFKAEQGSKRKTQTGTSGTSAKTRKSNSSSMQQQSSSRVAKPKLPQVVQQARNDIVRVKGGSFTMEMASEQEKNAFHDERLLHRVNLNSFSISKYEVTQEWCQDWHDENYYRVAPSSKPKGFSSGEGHVCRGGGWDSAAITCRVSSRYLDSPTCTAKYMGLRQAM